MKMKNLFSISFAFFMIVLHVENLSADETTSAEVTSFAQGASSLFNDNSCGAGNRSDLCCYHEIRYRCSFLRDQFLGGYCRPNASDHSDSSWTKCNSVPQVPPARATIATTSSRGSLPYATDLTNCSDEGERAAARYARGRGVRSGGGYCAVGVRNALMCMFEKQGRPRTVHCGGAAYNYYGEGCLERMGFRNTINENPSMCNTPGVVRVYYGHRHRQGSAPGGDQYGHIEFLGTDNWWHAGVAASQPIDHPQKAGNRRILKACYVLGGT